jgi:hypothetical protein
MHDHRHSFLERAAPGRYVPESSNPLGLPWRWANNEWITTRYLWIKCVLGDCVAHDSDAGSRTVVALWLWVRCHAARGL